MQGQVQVQSQQHSQMSHYTPQVHGRGTDGNLDQIAKANEAIRNSNLRY